MQEEAKELENQGESRAQIIKATHLDCPRAHWLDSVVRRRALFLARFPTSSLPKSKHAQILLLSKSSSAGERDPEIKRGEDKQLKSARCLVSSSPPEEKQLPFPLSSAYLPDDDHKHSIATPQLCCRPKSLAIVE